MRKNTVSGAILSFLLHHIHLSVLHLSGHPFTGNFPAISDDLVNSYHLLLCCIDWFFANALLGARKDLLKPDFAGKGLCSMCVASVGDLHIRTYITLKV